MSFPVGLQQCNVITTGTIETIINLECKTADINHVDRLAESFNESFKYVKIHNFPSTYIHSFKKDTQAMSETGVIENLDLLVENAVIINNSFDNCFEKIVLGENCKLIDINDCGTLKEIYITSKNTRIAPCFDGLLLNKDIVMVSVPENWKHTIESNIMWIMRRNNNPYDVNPFFKTQRKIMKRQTLFGEQCENIIYPGQLINPFFDPVNFHRAMDYYEKYVSEQKWNTAVENIMLNNFSDTWHNSFGVDDVNVELFYEANYLCSGLCYKLKDNLYFIIGKFGNTWLCLTDKQRVLCFNKNSNKFAWPIIPVSPQIKPPLHRNNNLSHNLSELTEVFTNNALSIVEGYSNDKECLVRYEIDRSELNSTGIFRFKIFYYKRSLNSGKTFAELQISEATLLFNINDDVDKIKILKLY